MCKALPNACQETPYMSRLTFTRRACAPVAGAIGRTSPADRSFMRRYRRLGVRSFAPWRLEFAATIFRAIRESFAFAPLAAGPFAAVRKHFTKRHNAIRAAPTRTTTATRPGGIWLTRRRSERNCANASERRRSAIARTLPRSSNPACAGVARAVRVGRVNQDGAAATATRRHPRHCVKRQVIARSLMRTSDERGVALAHQEIAGIAWNPAPSSASPVAERTHAAAIGRRGGAHACH